MYEVYAKVIGLTLASISVLAGGYKGVSWTHDKVQQIDELDMQVFLVGERLEQKILQDNANAVTQRKWSLEDRYKGQLTKAPESVREEYRKLGAEQAELEKKLQQVEQQVQSKRKELP